MQFAIVDIETTGGYAAANGITEIAVFVYDGSTILEAFNQLINPHQTIPRHITALTSITNEMVENAPSFVDVAEELFNLLQDKVFVAHNVNFDYSFIKHQLKYAGYELNVPRICSARLSRKVFANLPSHSLGNLCKSLSIPIENRHRAGGDAKATALLFKKIAELPSGDLHLREMLKRTSGEHWLPTLLNMDVVKNLPHKPGVYYFLNEKRKVIYVGKAVDLRKRVASHFMPNNPEFKRQSFLRQIADISFAECLSELHAIILESIEIRRLWPRYNYAQKQPSKKYALYKFEDTKGYARLAIDVQKKNLPNLFQFNLLLEGQTLLRKMIEEFDLHPQLCFLNNADSAEIVSKIPTAKNHNKKIEKALAALEIKLPTFVTYIVDENKNVPFCLLMEKGSFWGMGYVQDKEKMQCINYLKDNLTHYNDNDVVRHSIYKYVETYPDLRLPLKK